MSLTDFKRKINWQRFYGKSYQTETPWQISRQLESDRGRIINSAAIRRLQQKTQVFPLERNAAVRSRLTHSLEVQQVGRHITKEIFYVLDNQGRLESAELRDLLSPCESLVEMACLLHDIGNPPFGHFGEAAINSWFARFLSLESLQTPLSIDDNCPVACLRLDPQHPVEINELRKKVRQDLAHFEGNAQALRLVHSLLKLNLTYAQIACIIKYTRPAYWLTTIPPQFSYLMKKPGYYLSEETAVTQLYQQLQLRTYHRFPLTYIMEAADDISYCLADLEDAVEKNIITIPELYQKLHYHWQKGCEDNPAIAGSLLFDKVVERAFAAFKEQTIRYRSADDQFFMLLRVNTIGELVPHAAKRFVENLDTLLDGAFNQALLEDSSAAYLLLKIFKVVASNDVFCHEEVEQLELQGFRVINGLLDIYSPLLAMSVDDFTLLVTTNNHKKYPIESRLYHKLSRKHCLAYCEAMAKLDSQSALTREIMEYYYRVRLIQDYISGMTDQYAYDEYRRLTATL